MLYLDYAATTPVRPEVQEEMTHYFAAQFENPHSPHEAGIRVKAAVEEARELVGRVIGASPRQVVFTSGGTEANNLAIIGGARARRKKGNHLVTTPIEHKSVLGPMAALTKEGFRVDFFPLDPTGLLEQERWQESLTPQTTLVSVGHANNEIGTVQPVADLAPVLRKKGILFHCDCIQTFGKIWVKVEDVGADLISVSGHKLYGPKGVGFLYVGPGVRIEPLMYGGGQERGLRPGTLNVPAIMGLAKAVELAGQEYKRELLRLLVLRNELVNRALLIPGVYLNGHPGQRLPNHVNLGIEGIEGQVIVSEMGKRGIAISTGAACSSGSREPSHVLTALGQKIGEATQGFRITLGSATTLQDIFTFVSNLSAVVKDLSERFLLQI